jgi:hypothetical protein
MGASNWATAPGFTIARSKTVMSRRENYDTVRMLLSAQIVSDTHHASHMFQNPPRVAA